MGFVREIMDSVLTMPNLRWKWNVSEYLLYLIILDTGSEAKETKGQGQRF